MRPRISIRGSVRPSVCRLVGQLVMLLKRPSNRDAEGALSCPGGLVFIRLQLSTMHVHGQPLACRRITVIHQRIAIEMLLNFGRNAVVCHETRPDTRPGISRGGWAGAVKLQNREQKITRDIHTDGHTPL